MSTSEPKQVLAWVATIGVGSDGETEVCGVTLSEDKANAWLQATPALHITVMLVDELYDVYR